MARQMRAPNSARIVGTNQLCNVDKGLVMLQSDTERRVFLVACRTHSDQYHFPVLEDGTISRHTDLFPQGCHPTDFVNGLDPKTLPLKWVGDDKIVWSDEKATA